MNRGFSKPHFGHEVHAACDGGGDGSGGTQGGPPWHWVWARCNWTRAPFEQDGTDEDLAASSSALQENTGCRNLWASGTFSEMTAHQRGSQLTSAFPTAGHLRTKRPSAQVALCGPGQPPWINFWSPRAVREMPPHLAGRELRAAFPSARHARSWRSSNEIDGLGVQLRNLYAYPTPATWAHPRQTSTAERKGTVIGFMAVCGATQADHESG
jgi:hypothetical protein